MNAPQKALSAYSALSARDETEHAANGWVRDAEGRLRRGLPGAGWRTALTETGREGDRWAFG